MKCWSRFGESNHIQLTEIDHNPLLSLSMASSALRNPNPTLSKPSPFSSSPSSSFLLPRTIPAELRLPRRCATAMRPPVSVACTLTREPAAAAAAAARPDSVGRFGKFGGKYVPETLMHALAELEEAFRSLSKDAEFQVVSIFVLGFVMVVKLFVLSSLIG